MDNLVLTDRMSFDQVGDLFLYSGSTVKNIVRQATHAPDWRRVLHGLRQLSRIGNLRLHRHVIDGATWQHVPREDHQPKGSLDEELIDGVLALSRARVAVEAGNVDDLREARLSLLGIASQIGAEIRSLSVPMKMMEA